MRVIVTDCDGVLTDNKVPRRFSIADGHIPEGYKVIILTSAADTADMTIRMDQLGIEIVQTDRKRKFETLVWICAREKISIEEVVYIGDDPIDVDCMKAAGLSMAPKDATREAKRAADRVLKTKGGEGVLREVFELIERSK